MELADDEAWRALTFLVALEKEGYRPTVEELDAYVDEAPRRGDELSGIAAVVATFASMTRLVSGPPESMAAYLQRLRWVTFKSDRVHTSELGRAVEAALRRKSPLTEAVVDVMLDPADPFVTARAIQRIAAAGPGMLVDPYFRLEQLLPILQRTEITRVLTSKRIGSDECAGLSTALEQELGTRTIEIRVAGREVHDRHVISDDGKVLAIGASLNGLESASTIIYEVHDGATAVRDVYEVHWDNAEQLGKLRPAADPTPSTIADTPV